MKTVIYLHNMKTAGQTLIDVMYRQYVRSKIYKVEGRRFVESVQEFESLPDACKMRYKAIIGHMYFGVHKSISQPCTYITFLRNPIDRTLSLYYYLRRKPKHWLHVHAANSSIEKFMNDGVSILADNAMTRFLSGEEGVAYGECTHEMLDRAKCNIVDYVQVVGITERFDESLMLMKEELGWNTPFYVRKNVTSGRPGVEDLKYCDIEAVKVHNELDMELYRFSLEILNRKIIEKGPEFKERVERFRSMNKNIGRLGIWTQDVIVRGSGKLINLLD